MLDNIASRLHSAISSRGFYRFILVFFVFEAGFIALTAAYPQAFDEQFHFGLIKLYSHYWLPFFSHQPANANQFGEVARSPSYLYHYLMSFPYRFIALFIKKMSYQIVILRLIDIALFTWGLVLFKKLLVRTKLSEGVANLIILIFILIPIVPQLAGQINYDDLLVPLVALICLLSFNMIDQIKHSTLKFRTTLSMLMLAGFTSLVKFAFLPIFLAILCFFTVYLFYFKRAKIKAIFSNFVLDFKKQSLIAKVLLIGGLLVATAMFSETYFVNLAVYHSVNPSCSSVISKQACKSYYVWSTNNARHMEVVNDLKTPSENFIVYGFQWVYWMWYRLFFAVNGKHSHYTNYPPLPFPSAVALVVGIVGFIALIKYRKQLFKTNAYSTLLLTASVFYIVALMVQGYSTYQFTDVLENMNGRYLLPILLLAGALFAKALSLAFKRLGHRKVLVAVLVVILFLEGGGIFTYIARSNKNWYWQNPKVVKINKVAKKITHSFVIKGKKTYDTSFWFFN